MGLVNTGFALEARGREKYTVYRLVFLTHFLASKINKRRGASRRFYVRTSFYYFDKTLVPEKRPKMLAFVAYMRMSCTQDRTVHSGGCTPFEGPCVQTRPEPLESLSVKTRNNGHFVRHLSGAPNSISFH